MKSNVYVEIECQCYESSFEEFVTELEMYIHDQWQVLPCVHRLVLKQLTKSIYVCHPCVPAWQFCAPLFITISTDDVLVCFVYRLSLSPPCLFEPPNPPV